MFIFLGVFGICFGIWIVVKNHIPLTSPLARVLLEKNITTQTNKIQMLCIQDHLNCTNIVINPDITATVTIDTDEQVLFCLQKDLIQQFSSLQVTEQHLTIEGKRFHRLDFRFDNPVISY